MSIHEGSTLLGKIARRHTTIVLSGMLGVSNGTIRNWIKGRSTPTLAAQTAMAAHPDIGIPVTAWGKEALPQAKPARSPRPKAATEPGPPLGTAREEVARTVAILSRQMHEADADEHASWSHKASLANAFTSALRVQARLDGSGELSEAQIVRSRPFARAMKVIEAALGDHPAAALAVAEALESFGASDAKDPV